MPRPPLLPRLLLRLLLPPEAEELIRGDLDEEFHLRHRSSGLVRAHLWYWSHALRSVAAAARPGIPLWRLMSGVGDDLRYALRALSRRRGYVATTALTIALGTGAVTAVFTLARAVFWAPLPYDDPDAIMMIWHQQPSATSGLDWPEVRGLSSAAADFETVAAYRGGEELLLGSRFARVVPAARASEGLMAVLGVQMGMGRWFTAGEVGTGASRVAVVTHGFWQNVLGGRPDVLGSMMEVESGPVTVVGVLPAAFTLRSQYGSLKGHEPEVWMPTGLDDFDLSHPTLGE